MEDMESTVSTKPVLVIGGGIAGMTAALEAAEAGCSVVLVERSPFLGGRVARTYQYFPKLCPPPAASRSTSNASRTTPASRSSPGRR